MWKRPQNSLDNVPITYKVSINTTEGVAVSENYTANQFLSLGFIERQARSTGRRCELYSITVEATNEDGTGPPSESIVTTIPTCKNNVSIESTEFSSCISLHIYNRVAPDVSNISEHLTVETVDLRSLTVDISFPQIVRIVATHPSTSYNNSSLSLSLSSLSPSPLLPFHLFLL